MPKTRANGLFEYSQFKGLRNTVPAEHMAAADIDPGDLSLARNVDINDAGRVLRRKGHEPLATDAPFSSLYSDGTVCCAVRNRTELVRILPDLSTVTLRTGLTPGPLMSYATIGSRVYYSNGVETGVIEHGASRSWGLEPPSAQPQAEVVAGTLRAGRYQYAVTFVRSDGQESGSQRAGYIDLGAPGGIRLTDLPVSADPSVSVRAIYFSACNGEGLYRVATGMAFLTDFTLTSDPSVATPMRTQHLRPAPAGHIVEAFAGWALVASGDTLYYSEPYSPELFDLRKGLRMAAPINFVATLDTGAYVGTDAGVVWLKGDSPDKWEYSTQLAYGAVRGTVVRASQDALFDGQGSQQVVLFATDRGLCVGDGGGTITNITQPRFSYPPQPEGAAMVRRQRGMNQLVVTLRGPEGASNEAA